MYARASLVLLVICALFLKQPPAVSGQKPDFSTPRAAAETFIRAMQTRDVETLARCYNTSVVGENHATMLEIIKQWPLDGYARVFAGARVADVKISERNAHRAAVTVRFADGDTERLTLAEGPSGWNLVPG